MRSKSVIWVVIIVICLQVERKNVSIFAKWKVRIEKPNSNLPEFYSHRACLNRAQYYFESYFEDISSFLWGG